METLSFKGNKATRELAKETNTQDREETPLFWRRAWSIYRLHTQAPSEVSPQVRSGITDEMLWAYK